MKENEALQLQREIEDICKKHGLWMSVEHEKKPELKMIKIKEISIKVTEN